MVPRIRLSGVLLDSDGHPIPGGDHEKVFPILLGDLEEGPAHDLIKQAKSIAETSDFVLFETTLAHDCVNERDARK